VTGICLVIQRDTIQTAKLVAALDQVSGGRSLFGIDGGWNQEATSTPRGSMSV
jgi:alkanesulfonate monooxygenase SsuD/methylene tetrahydromethanopterin reductase-like flavin-dependent oxidoreductase (luciferase family)